MVANRRHLVRRIAARRQPRPEPDRQSADEAGTLVAEDHDEAADRRPDRSRNSRVRGGPAGRAAGDGRPTAFAHGRASGRGAGKPRGRAHITLQRKIPLVTLARLPQGEVG